MKRVLLLGIILAIFILAMPQGVLAVTDPTVPVNANAAYDVHLHFNAALNADAQ